MENEGDYISVFKVLNQHFGKHNYLLSSWVLDEISLIHLREEYTVEPTVYVNISKELNLDAAAHCESIIPLFYFFLSMYQQGIKMQITKNEL